MPTHPGDRRRRGAARADTAARHARQDAFTTQIRDERFTAFRTGTSKSRQAFLSLLRAGHGEYVINDAALAYMRGRALAGPVIEQLGDASDQGLRRRGGLDGAPGGAWHRTVGSDA